MSNQMAPSLCLPRACVGSKSIRPVWIRAIENFLTHPSTSISIIELQYNKYKKSQQSIMVLSKIKSQNKMLRSKPKDLDMNAVR